MRRAATKIGLVAILTMAVLGSTASAGRQPTLRLVVNPSSVEVGQTYAVSATATDLDCPAQLLTQDVQLTIQQISPSAGSVESLGTLPASGVPDGPAGPVSFTAPATPGTYLIEPIYENLCFDGPIFVTTATLIVTAASTTSTTTTTTTTTTTSTTVVEGIPPTTAAPTTAAPTTAAPALPATGRSTDGLVWAALAAVVLGGALVTVAARRS